MIIMIETIQLSHGSGRGLDSLLHEVILPELSIDTVLPLEDAAVLKLPTGRIAFTTDSFVVQPLEFPGGNIGKLSVCGTVNDLAMMGARPYALSVALILEEGLEVAVLRRVLRSLADEARNAGVTISCGDTKVVDKGKADGMFITTSGIGVVPDKWDLSVGSAHPGDAVLVSGPIGCHGIAILAARKGLNFASQAVSDCACLYTLAEKLLAAAPHARCLRDATRGGCSAVLNEIAQASKATIAIDQDAVPVPPEVASACGFLGFDPLDIANEGRFIAVVPKSEATAALAALRSDKLGSSAAVIGKVEEKGRFGVVMKTVIGGTRVVDVPAGELLPRIC
jgi:hydrogenase expression/formation protein HypE